MARVEAGKCPECGEMVEVDPDVEVGDQIFCPGCDCELEVTRLHPPRFKVLRGEDIEDLEDSEDELDEESDWYGDEDKDEDEDEDKY